MPTFDAFDGTRLAYRTDGDGAGDPVLCLPGGPMQDSIYLGDLGGLSRRHRLIVLELRGTGASAIPADASSYRCDRLVDDVETLREHLGLDTVDLLGHSAGANIAVRYAERHPARVGKLALITPSTRAVGLPITADDRRPIAERRRDESWFPEAFGALEAIMAGEGDDWAAATPFFHGRWDDAARRFEAAASEQEHPEAAEAFGADGAFDPELTRAALAHLAAPVLLLAGEVDLNSPPAIAAAFAGLFAHPTLVVQSGAGHYPWLDAPAAFVATVAGFLD